MPRVYLQILCLFAGAVFLAGCAVGPSPPPRPSEGPSYFRLAVIDGRLGDDAAGTERTTGSWGLGSYVRYDNGNANRQLADALGREMRGIPGLEVVPRSDFRLYLAGKERLLEDAAPDMTPEQRRETLEAQSPVDYGRSLNADFVLSNTIHESYTQQRTVLYVWKSGLDATIELWDARSGELVWRNRTADNRALASPTSLMEDRARRVREALLAENFFALPLPADKPAGAAAASD